MKGPRKRPLFYGGSVRNTDPTTRKQNDAGRLSRQAKKILSATHKTARRQADRRSIGLRLAGAILGHKVHLKDGVLWSNRIGGGPLLETGDTWSRITRGGELVESGPARGLRYAYLLAKGAAAENHVTGIMDGGEKGEFIGGTALWKPSLRLDPNWAEAMRRRSRKEAKERIKHVEAELPPNEQIARAKGWGHRLGWKLLTLTMPHTKGQTTLEQIRLFNDAFRRLGKTGIWKKVWAGVKGIENRLTADGPHVHAHLLILSRRIDRQKLREAWGECLNASAEHLGEIVTYPSTSDGLPLIDIREVKDNPDKARQDQTTQEAALDEVSKYITKTDDLLEPNKEGRTVSPETLLELCDVKRWPRMFELLGKARRAVAAAKRAFLDTSCISAAGAFQKHKVWLQERLFGFESDEGTLRPDPEKAEVRTVQEKKRERVASWRDLMSTMDLSEWCREIDKRVRNGAAFRLRWLKTHNPTLFLVTLAGDIVANQCEAYEQS